MAEVNRKNVQGERNDQEDEEDGCHGSKKNKELSRKILAQKGESLKGNERQGIDVAHLLLNLVLHVNEGKREIRSKAKKAKEKIPRFIFIIFSLLELWERGRRPRNQEVPYCIKWRLI